MRRALSFVMMLAAMASAAPRADAKPRAGRPIVIAFDHGDRVTVVGCSDGRAVQPDLAACARIVGKRASLVGADRVVRLGARLVPVVGAPAEVAFAIRRRAPAAITTTGAPLLVWPASARARLRLAAAPPTSSSLPAADVAVIATVIAGALADPHHPTAPTVQPVTAIAADLDGDGALDDVVSVAIDGTRASATVWRPHGGAWTLLGSPVASSETVTAAVALEGLGRDAVIVVDVSGGAVDRVELSAITADPEGGRAWLEAITRWPGRP